MNKKLDHAIALFWISVLLGAFYFHGCDGLAQLAHL